MQKENEKIFQTLIFEPLPEDVTQVKGFKNQEGKADTFFKFVVTESGLKKLLQLHEYKSIDCTSDTVVNQLFVPVDTKDFVEGSIFFWDIVKVEDKVCYATFLFTSSGIEGKLYNNSIRQRAHSELLIDQKNNTVYFHESGR